MLLEVGEGWRTSDPGRLWSLPECWKSCGCSASSTSATMRVLHAGVFIALIASFVLLVAALRSLPAGTAYAVWTGIGATGVALMGMVLFGEPVNVARVVFIALIVMGIVGLRLTHS